MIKRVRTEQLKIKQPTLWMRLYFYNWSVDRAFNTPVGGKQLR